MTRLAVRAVISKNHKLYMIQTNLGDVKFVGGGLEKDETHVDALKREALEEAGIIIDISSLLGTTYQLRKDFKDSSKTFEMTSYYYAASIVEENHQRALSKNEKALAMTPIWINVDEAIRLNKKALDKNSWVKRELKVLKTLKTQLDSL